MDIDKGQLRVDLMNY